MNLNKKNILLSCAGGLFTIQNIIGIKKIKGFKFNVYGIDQKEISKPNKDLLSNFSICPNTISDKKNYIKFIKSYCKKFKIDIFFPFSDEEINLLSEIEIPNFKTKIILPETKLLNLLSDKYNFLKFLKGLDLIEEELFEINSLNNLKKVINNNSFKLKKFVLKPRISRGSRGVLIFNENSKFIEPLDNRICAIGPKQRIIDYIKRKKISLNNFFLMKYYSNNNIDVDCFAKKGKIKYLAIRKREWTNPLSPVSEGCRIIKNSKIKRLVENIVLKLNLNGILDLDISIDQKNKPHIIDVSSRLSGSVSSGLVVDMNIFEIIIKDLYSIKYKSQFSKKEKSLRVANLFIEVEN